MSKKLRDRINLDQLENLLDEKDVEIRESSKVMAIPKHSIYAEEQVRKVFDVEKLQELSVSIEVNGQEQPIVVYPQDGKGFKIQKGERRWRAVMMNDNLTHVDAVIKERGDIFGQLIENIQRENLNAIELGESFKQAKELHGLDNRQLAAKIGKNEVYISKYIQALNAPEYIIDAYKEGKVGDVDTINELRKADAKNHEKIKEVVTSSEKISRPQATELNKGKKRPKRKKTVSAEKELLKEMTQCIRGIRDNNEDRQTSLEGLFALAEKAESVLKGK